MAFMVYKLVHMSLFFLKRDSYWSLIFNDLIIILTLHYSWTFCFQIILYKTPFYEIVVSMKIGLHSIQCDCISCQLLKRFTDI